MLEMCDELERRVEERTAELRVINEALQRELAEHKRAEDELRKLNAELEQRVAGRTGELAALYEVTAVTSGESPNLETALERVLVAMRSHTGAIHLMDETGETLHLAVQQGIPPGVVAQMDSIPSCSGLVGRVVEHGEPLVVRDLSADPRAPQAVRATGLHAYVGVPMRAGGRVVGVLSVFGEAEHPFNVEEIALLASIADHVGVAVENVYLFDRIQRRRRELGALYRADEELYRHLQLDQVL